MLEDTNDQKKRIYSLSHPSSRKREKRQGGTKPHWRSLDTATISGKQQEQTHNRFSLRRRKGPSTATLGLVESDGYGSEWSHSIGIHELRDKRGIQRRDASSGGGHSTGYAGRGGHSSVGEHSNSYGGGYIVVNTAGNGFDKNHGIDAAAVANQAAGRAMAAAGSIDAVAHAAAEAAREQVAYKALQAAHSMGGYDRHGGGGGYSGYGGGSVYGGHGGGSGYGGHEG